MAEGYDDLAPVHEMPERDAGLAELRREDPVHGDDANPSALIDGLDELPVEW